MADFLQNFRDQLLCRKCEKIPKPENPLMRCSSCKELLCNECCGRKCPLCRHRSKDSKISTFIEETELTKLLSSYKTRPCPNFKNGCLDEVSIKSDEWKVHDQNCIFQMVPCPKMNWKEILVGFHGSWRAFETSSQKWCYFHLLRHRSKCHRIASAYDLWCLSFTN